MEPVFRNAVAGVAATVLPAPVLRFPAARPMLLPNGVLLSLLNTLSLRVLLSVLNSTLWLLSGLDLRPLLSVLWLLPGLDSRLLLSVLWLLPGLDLRLLLSVLGAPLRLLFGLDLWLPLSVLRATLLLSALALRLLNVLSAALLLFAVALLLALALLLFALALIIFVFLRCLNRNSPENQEQNSCADQSDSLEKPSSCFVISALLHEMPPLNTNQSSNKPFNL